MQARSRKPCLNNIEKALQILYQKGAPTRLIPTAVEIFEGDKNTQRVWPLLKVIFDLFAMVDVNKSTMNILRWISMCLFQTGNQVKHKFDKLNHSINILMQDSSMKNNILQEIYGQFQDGIMMMCIIRMYIRQDPNLQENTQIGPTDTRNIFLYPLNKQEVIHNQFQVCNALRRNGINVFLHPQEIVDNI